MKDLTYQRIRAACCDQHGLGKGTTFRNDPRELDEHAAQITAVVLKARRDAAKKKVA